MQSQNFVINSTFNYQVHHKNNILKEILKSDFSEFQVKIINFTFFTNLSIKQGSKFIKSRHTVNKIQYSYKKKLCCVSI